MGRVPLTIAFIASFVDLRTVQPREHLPRRLAGAKATHARAALQGRVRLLDLDLHRVGRHFDRELHDDGGDARDLNLHGDAEVSASRAGEEQGGPAVRRRPATPLSDEARRLRRRSYSSCWSSKSEIVLGGASSPASGRRRRSRPCSRAQLFALKLFDGPVALRQRHGRPSPRLGARHRCLVGLLALRSNSGDAWTSRAREPGVALGRRRCDCSRRVAAPPEAVESSTTPLGAGDAFARGQNRPSASPRARLRALRFQHLHKALLHPAPVSMSYICRHSTLTTRSPKKTGVSNPAGIRTTRKRSESQRPTRRASRWLLRVLGRGVDTWQQSHEQAWRTGPRWRGHPARVIAVVNQKGGVGKTTTAVNLAASVAAAERRTLLIDLDPQGNASSGVGVSPRTVERSIYDALIGRAHAARHHAADGARVAARSCRASRTSSRSRWSSSTIRTAPTSCAALLAALRRDEPFEYVFIDCPPSLGILTVNALVGGRPRARSAAVRVLRARGADLAHGDDRPRAGGDEPAPRGRGHRARRCSTRGTTSRTRWPTR